MLLVEEMQNSGADAKLVGELSRLSSLFGDRLPLERVWSQRGYDKFKSLAVSRQQELLKALAGYYELVSGALSSDPEALNSESRLLRQVIRNMNLIISESVYSLIEKDDIIEIYSKDLVQVYRGMGFMSICNYTLLELLTHEFHELYERSQQINGMMFEAVGRVAEVDMHEGLPVSNIPKHLMRELFSEDRGVFQVEFRYMFPLFVWPQKYFGFLVIQKAKVYQEPEIRKESVHFL
ncbi:MAG: hypothetical protein KF802_03645 [Bdellovibrionaceae bacterium]|nr:hypothetical protein [Pseudobdellovibrionaceae bacterium]MBX3033284.1 hypothetical protein [Pseudobdellovibrionaceae bacterium]